MKTSVGDNRCKCNRSRKLLYHSLQAGLSTPSDMPDLSNSDVLFKPGWRDTWDPMCIEGTHLSDHPGSPCMEHRRTMALHMCAFLGLCLLCAAIGVCFRPSVTDIAATSNATARVMSSPTPQQQTLSASSMSLLAVAVWRHVMDLLRARAVKWPNSRMTAALAIAPLLTGVVSGVVAFVHTEATVMLSVGCSIGSMYLAEVMAAVGAWKQQRLERRFTNFEVGRLLKSSYRSAIVLPTGVLLPVVLTIGACAPNATTPSLVLIVVGSVLWLLSMGYVLNELRGWFTVSGTVQGPDCFWAPVMGTALLITPERSNESTVAAAQAAPLLPQVARELATSGDPGFSRGEILVLDDDA